MRHNSPRILIVEDDMVLAMVQARMVERLGYEVLETAMTGEEAVQIARDQEPDAILMDIKLNGTIDGFEAVKQIREFLDVPIIYISGHTSKDSYEQARELGYSEFLVKPVRSEDLKNSLHGLFDSNSEEWPRSQEPMLN